jgi:hypothetical protein
MKIGHVDDVYMLYIYILLFTPVCVKCGVLECREWSSGVAVMYGDRIDR